MTIHWKAVEQYFTVVLYDFQFDPVFNFGKFISFGFGTVYHASQDGGSEVFVPRNPCGIITVT